MRMAMIVGAIAAAWLAGCSQQTDPDQALPGGNPFQPQHLMSSQGTSPSPILTPNEKNQDKTSGQR
jgi:hypothetical protein